MASAVLLLMVQTKATPGTTLVTALPLRTIKPVGESFSVNLTIGDVQDLWGFEYWIHYNTTVLNVTNYAIYDYFADSQKLFTINTQLTSVDEAGGLVKVVATGEYGSHTGFSTTDSKPMARVDFIVTANGTSTLKFDQENSAFVTIYGDRIYPITYNDGYFSTKEISLHDIAITDIRVSSTSVHAGDQVTIDVDLKNNGNFIESFSVSIKYNQTTGVFTTIREELVSGLALDASTTVEITWTVPSNLVEGKYVIRAEAIVADEAVPADNVRESTAIALTKATGGTPFNVLYIGIGVIAVIAVVVVVYVLKIRKSVSKNP